MKCPVDLYFSKKQFNKTNIPFALALLDTSGYSQRGAKHSKKADEKQ